MSLLAEAGVRSRRARIVIGVFVLLFSASLVLTSVTYYVADGSRDQGARTDAGVRRLAECTAGWQRDYVSAQAERLPTSVAKDNAYLALLRDLRPVITAVMPTGASRDAATAALDRAIGRARTLQDVQFKVQYPDYYCTLDGRVNATRGADR